MKKNSIWKILVLATLVLSMCLPFAGCRKTPADNAEQTTTAPVTDTAPEQTNPQTTEPTEPDDEPVILQAGAMQKHMKGKNGDLGIYFKMDLNDVPVDTSWVTEFRPTSKSTIQLIRGGETYDIGRTAAGMIVKYSDTDYYLKLEEYLLREYFPVRNGDILKIEGIFRNAAVDTMFQIDTSYIQISEGLVFFSTEYPTGGGVSVKYVGNPTSHPNGKTADGIYFKLDKNSVPYNDWTVEYNPASESSVQLIRNGKTYNIGNKAAGMIVKYNDTDYYLKLEKWIIKDFYPIRDGDVIVLNGKFVNSGVSTVFSISKTYISISEGLLTFSTEYPTESTVEAQVIPTMLPHPNGFIGTGVYFMAAEENTLPYDGWTVEYFPREAGCIKLIRNGETYDIANVNAGSIVKFSDKDYYFKLDQWMYQKYFPFGDGDILIVEGKFVNAGLAGLMEIGKTYIAISSGMAYFSTEYPDGPVGPTKVQGGAMLSHPDGWKSDTNGGLYFKLEAGQDAPFATDWSVRYVPTSADAIKLIRDGVTTNVANTAAEMIAKYREDSYYLEFWPISMKPIVEGDTLVIEGSFVNAANNTVLVIDKTYVTIENGQPVFTTDKDVVIEAGHMQPHDNGFNTSSNDGLYFKLDANDAPYNGWDVEYEPVSAASIQLIRGEETFNIGIPGRGTIVKYSDTEYYLKLAKWTIGDYFPIVPGDQLIVEGQFKNAENGVIFNISRTAITVGEDYSLTFASEEAVDPTIQAGMMSSHPNGWNTQNNKGMYFTLESNDVPFSDDWSVFYYPTTAENIKLIRDGETVNIAQTDREFIVKYGDTDHYLKLEKWTIGDYFPLVPGDTLIVEGKFNNPVAGVVFNITKTYITIGEGYSLTFSENAPETEEPDEPEVPQPANHGPMAAHGTNGWTATGGLYFTMAKNDVPYDGWNTRYTPVAASCVKLIRGGTTYDVGHTARETITKYSDTEYYYEFWTLDTYKPVVAGDVLIVEGDFVNKASGATLSIAKTTITFNADGTATFQSEVTEPEKPEEPEVPQPANHGPMAAHGTNGWTATGGLYFTMAKNDVPYDGWNTRYTPVAASCVKLIRGGTTYDVGHTARETITKYSDTEYYYEFWTLDTYKPVVAGDVLIVEGDFVNKASGATLSIAKTTITFNADGTATFQSEVTEPEKPEEPEIPEQEKDGLVLKAWDEKAWNANSNGGFWFTMDANDIPADDTWVLEYTPVSEDVLKLVRGGETVNIAIPGRGTLVKASEAEYYLKLDWNIGDYSKTITVGDQIIVEGDFTNATNGVTFTVKKTTITVGEDYVLTFESEEEEEPEEGVLEVGPMSENSGGLSDAILYFSLAENELPSSLIKSDFRPVSADVIKLVRDGVTYEIGDPNAKTVVKQTAAGRYRLLRNALTMQIQAGDILIVDGKFTGGNSGDTVYTIRISKTYILIGNATVSFSTEPPVEE